MVTLKKKVNSFSSITCSGETVSGKENIDLNEEVDGKECSRELCEQIEQEDIKSLDKVLVKHISRLEKEKQDVIVPSLDKFLVKRVSRLEREVQEAKSRSKNCQIEGGNEVTLKKKNDSYTPVTKSEENIGLHKEAVSHAVVPGLDKFLVKHVSRLEREVQEAKNKR